MGLLSFSDAKFAGKRKQTRREVFSGEMEAVILSAKLIALIEPAYAKAGKGPRPYALETMPHIHFMQRWFVLSDPAMEEALYDSTSMRQFSDLRLTRHSFPDETMFLNFRHLLERNHLAGRLLAEINAMLGERGLWLRRVTIMGATIIAVPSSTKDKAGQRNPEIPRCQNSWNLYRC